jgi:hypothetical protein
LPLRGEEKLWEVPDRRYMPLMQPHHVLYVVTGVVASGGRVLEVVRVAVLCATTSIFR